MTHVALLAARARRLILNGNQARLLVQRGPGLFANWLWGPPASRPLRL